MTERRRCSVCAWSRRRPSPPRRRRPVRRLIHDETFCQTHAAAVRLLCRVAAVTVVLFSASLVWCSPAFPQASAEAVGPPVTIEGGADATGNNYAWTVTNNGKVPIVFIEFPHFGADGFTAPDGWEVHCTNLLNLGVRNPEGVCQATAKTPSDGIAPGRSASFHMRVSAQGAHSAPGQVKLRLEDGTELVAQNISLPQRESFGDQYISFIGLAIIFVVFVVATAVRRRSKRSGDASEESGGVS